MSRSDMVFVLSLLTRFSERLITFRLCCSLLPYPDHPCMEIVALHIYPMYDPIFIFKKNPCVDGRG